jgi:homoserine dehydrogenase
MPSPTSINVVLKFGSSVLRSPASLPIAVTEIYRHYREGRRVIAVVSAFEGVTDRLLEEASAQGESPDPAALAVLLSTGETASAAQLAMALHRAGVPARYTDPRDIGLTAAGDRSNAELAQVRIDRLEALLDAVPVLVVPGFFAEAAEGGLALLGRGGSDLTALYLAAHLRARCILLKDVDGLYEADPATCLDPPRRFAQADYAAAEACAGSLVQPKAVRFARDRALTLDLARVGRPQFTRIGPDSSLIGAAPIQRRIRIALLGLGTVGRGVLDYCGHFADLFDVVAALVRTPRKHLARGVPESILVTSAQDAFAREPEIVVEVLPGIEPARTCLRRACGSGIRVVTANKALLSADWNFLAPQLADPGRLIRYSAAVGGAVPMLEAIEGLAARGRIVRLRGVVNGTCNFILDRCSEGEAFAEAVRSAQQRGFAEADPGADLSGLDAARKMEIMGRVAFGGEPLRGELEGIDENTMGPVNGTRDGRWALVAEARRTEQGFGYSVAPRLLAPADFLAGARGAENRLEITTADGAIVALRGLGAGRVPTATAVFADLLEQASALRAQFTWCAPETLPYIDADRAPQSCGIMALRSGCPVNTDEAAAAP